MNTAARRSKTLMATSTHVEIGVLGQRRLLRTHALERNGSVIFSLDDMPAQCVPHAAPGRPGPALDLMAVDVSSVSGPDRIRGTVRLTGTLDILEGPFRDELCEHLDIAENSLIGRLSPTWLSLEWRVETPEGTPTLQEVDIDDYHLAPVDPLAGWQDRWTAHLFADHQQALRSIAAGHVEMPEGTAVRPMLADAFGMVLRLSDGSGWQDLRVPFPQAVACGCEAVQAFNLLVETAEKGREEAAGKVVVRRDDLS
ncbi:hypothetical protein KEM60_01267 [Austwickia sp. TVS 96-490-7B]|uniref:DUF2470 domain-containing protein n=1 Tax=Austwickia sp. TVS 96-490-7B TaxID=2830843 RepID=UPI001C57D936|nr:DUF2470 domain-containing protein [Austwickia sp. TVS 96-490-7B]MBW3085075.1 hypothetical protein [Austwickia sp. TVS 96-490-7B]